MEQIEIYLSGSRDYSAIHGGTGPLVYPAGHVYVYRGLYGLTDGGTSIRSAQWFFAGLYLSGLTAALLVLRRAGAPVAVLALTMASRRMHSIFVLRLFNDGVAATALWIAVCLWQHRWWTLGSLVFSAAVAVKMVVLLALPGAAAIFVAGRGQKSSGDDGRIDGAGAGGFDCRTEKI